MENSGVKAGGLTPREMEVLTFLARGLSTKEIACRMKISRRMVKTYVRNIKDKTGSETREEAVYKATLWGIIIA